MAMTKPEPHYIDVDFKRETHYKPTKVTQNDTDIVFVLRVTDDGRSDPTMLDAFTTITLTSKRRDGRSFYVLGERIPETNEIRFELGTKELELPGKVTASIQLYSVDGRMSSAKFNYTVDGDVAEDYEPTESEGSLIETVLVEGPRILVEAEAATLASIQAREALTGAVTGALESLETDKAAALQAVATAVEETYQSRVGANAAANRANASADTADQVAAAAEAVRLETETVRENTENERLATQSEREETESVRESVEELLPQTEQARNKANNAGDYAKEQGDIAKQQSADQLLQMGTVAEQLEYVQDDFLPGIAESVAETSEFVRQAVRDRNSGAQLAFWTGTLAEYDALASKNPSVVYLVRK